MIDAPAQPGGPEGITDARRSSLPEAMLLVFAVGLCIAHGGGLLVFSSYTPRMVLLLIAGVPGVLVLVRLARWGDRPARWAVAVVGWVVVAALFSGAATTALKGTIGTETSAVILVLSLGVWALGRVAPSRAKQRLPLVIVIGLLANAFVGIAQVALSIEHGPFALQLSRAPGLTPSPVYFGALMAAGAALAVATRPLGSSTRVALVTTFGWAANLSGSRVALLAGLVGVVTSLALTGEFRRVRSLAHPVGFLSGVAASALLNASNRTSTARVGTGTGGRLDAWEYGVAAVVDKPVFGWGLGRFRAATQGRFTADFVRTVARDDLRQAWFDAHNIVVNLAVGIGIVGVAMMLGWLSSCIRQLRGDFIAPLVALGCCALLQPMGLAVLPLTMFMLGAADARTRPATIDHVSTNALVALMVGVALAGWLAIGDLRLSAAIDSGSPREVESAARWFPHDAVVSDLAAQAWFVRAQVAESAREPAIVWSRRAVDADPDRPYLLVSYAARLAAFGDDDGAREQLTRALELQPWHLEAWWLTYAIANRQGDLEAVGEAVARLCELGELMDDCPGDPHP